MTRTTTAATIGSRELCKFLPTALTIGAPHFGADSELHLKRYQARPSPTQNYHSRSSRAWSSIRAVPETAVAGFTSPVAGAEHRVDEKRSPRGLRSGNQVYRRRLSAA